MTECFDFIVSTVVSTVFLNLIYFKAWMKPTALNGYTNLLKASWNIYSLFFKSKIETWTFFNSAMFVIKFSFDLLNCSLINFKIKLFIQLI